MYVTVKCGADFRHPVFRLASPRGTRWGCSGQPLEAQNAEFSMNDIECKSAIAAPLHLVPSREEPAHTFEERIGQRYGMPCLRRRAPTQPVTRPSRLPASGPIDNYPGETLPHW
jgi:hypothetical protein